MIARLVCGLAVAMVALTHIARAQDCGPTVVSGWPASPPLDQVRGAGVWDPDGVGPRLPTIVVGTTPSVYPDPASVRMWLDGDWKVLARRVMNGVESGYVGHFFEWQGSLVMCGWFDSVDGIACRNVARWDGTSWHPMGSGVAGGGRRVLVFRDEVYVVAAGSSAEPLVPWLVRWDGQAWHEVIGAPESESGYLITGIVSNDQIVISGWFSSIEGVPAANIAAWDGSAWHAIGTGLPNYVEALGEFQGELVASWAGFWSGGPGAARWTGSAWVPLYQTVEPRFGLSPEIFYFAEKDGNLYASGLFGAIDGVAARSVARWDGAQWHDAGVTELTFAPKILATPDALFYVGDMDIIGSLHNLPAVARLDGSGLKFLWNHIVGEVLTVASHDGALYFGGRYLWSDTSGFPVVTRCDENGCVRMDSGIVGAVERMWSAGGSLFASTSVRVNNTWTGSFTYRLEGSQWTPLAGLHSQSYIEDIVWHDGSLWFVGWLSKSGPVFREKHVLRWDGTTWHETGFPENVYTDWLNIFDAHSSPDGCFTVVGQLSGSGRTAFAIQNCGNGWTEMPIDPVWGTAYAAATYRGKLCLAGRFERWVPIGQSCSHVIEWNGATWDLLNETSLNIDSVYYAHMGVVGRDLIVAVPETSLPGPTTEMWSRWDGRRWCPIAREMPRWPYRVVEHGDRLVSVSPEQFSEPNEVISFEASCTADIDDGTGTGVCDGGVDVQDLLFFLAQFDQGGISADVTGSFGVLNPDGAVTVDDLLFFLARFEAGC